MNYYRRNLGDYARKTAHLSLLEHGAYALLLDRYYSIRGPIRADHVYRVTRANTRSERAAVDRVLTEFFALDRGAWRSDRADEEISAYAERARTNKGVAEDRERRRRIGKTPLESKEPKHETCTDRAPIHNPEYKTEASIAASVAAAAAENGSLVLDGGEQPEPVAVLKMIGERTFAVMPATVTMYEHAYPGVPVVIELRRMAAWLESNPRKRPTPGGALRFINAWLSREANSAAERGVRGYQSARVIDGGRRESLCERAARLGREGDDRERAGLALIDGRRA